MVVDSKKEQYGSIAIAGVARKVRWLWNESATITQQY
jgi:hypothetical protein